MSEHGDPSGSGETFNIFPLPEEDIDVVAFVKVYLPLTRMNVELLDKFQTTDSQVVNNEMLASAIVTYAIKHNKQFWWVESDHALSVRDIAYRCKDLLDPLDLLEEVIKENSWSHC